MELEIAAFIDSHPFPWQVSRAGTSKATISDAKGATVGTLHGLIGSDPEMAAMMLCEAINTSHIAAGPEWFFGTLQSIWSFSLRAAGREIGPEQDDELNTLVASVMGNRPTIEGDDRRAIVTAVIRQCAQILGLTEEPHAD